MSKFTRQGACEATESLVRHSPGFLCVDVKADGFDFDGGFRE